VPRLTNLQETEVGHIVGQLPDVDLFDSAGEGNERQDDLFLACLGFEDRSLWIPELLAEGDKYKAVQAVYFEYGTNQNDNELNRPRLVQALESFSASVRPMPCDSDDFPSHLRALLREATAKSASASVTLDISVCSSRLLVTTLSILLQSEIDLRIVYSEAGLYHPTRKEYDAEPEKWTKDEGHGLTHGVSAVTPSPEHPGSRRDILPEAVIVFPTFKPERARAILAHVDPSLLVRPEGRVIWLIGSPHLPEDGWRSEIVRRINEIASSAPAYEVSTFNYKKTIEALDRAYKPLDCKYHVTIAPLGSKLQSVGIVLFWYVRPEVSIVFASPKEYNAAQYSERCKAVWRIDFGPVGQLRKLLGTVGQLRLPQ